MARINAFFETFLDKELYSKIQGRSKVIRVYCNLQFRTPTGFTEPYLAIIDTGAHTSIIPARIWKMSDHTILGDHYIAGLVPNAKLDVEIGEMKAVFIDVVNTSKEYSFLCFLSPDDRIPLILGFKELLSELRLTIDYPKNVVWLEERPV